MKFIPLHGLNADHQQFRFFLNAERIVSVCPARDEYAGRGYRSEIVLNNGDDIAVTESITTVVKRLNGGKE